MFGFRNPSKCESASFAFMSTGKRERLIKTKDEVLVAVFSERGEERNAYDIR